MRSSNTSEHSSNDLGDTITKSKITMRHIRFIIKDSTPRLNEYCTQLGLGLVFILIWKMESFL